MCGCEPVFADRDWYRARPERTERFDGTLEPRATVLGPATRGGLDYTLVSADGRWPVYAAGAEDVLGPHLGRPVTVEAKVVAVDGTDELWIASIRTSPG